MRRVGVARRATRLLVAATWVLAPSPARAETPVEASPLSADSGDASSYAVFALILGVNASVDPGTPTLHYADDDAARYLELFRSLGARTYVLTRLDENTERLHPQMAAEALLPIRADFGRAVATLAHDVDQARQRHVKTILYFVYAGHGNVEDGKGYITLEDARLDATTLDRTLIDAVSADQTHLIVDACDSYFLALGRGPGGQRRETHGFAGLGGLKVRDSVGLLLSTSTARESHEWSGFQAGVFSHEVRSALYGAADADGDGQVSYREVAAFVDRANQSIPNERYRPNVYARPPKDTPVLLDLRGRIHSRIDVPGTHAGRYLLEDSRGVRIADFHNAEGQAAYLLRPRYTGRLYLRRPGDDIEFVVPSSPDVVDLAMLTPSEPREHTRGAASDAYELLFALPFGERVVDHFTPAQVPVDVLPPARDALPVWRVGVGLGFLTVAVAAGTVGALTLKSADDLSASVSPKVSGTVVEGTNDEIRARNVQAGVELGGAAAAAVSGALLLLWPRASFRPDLGASSSALTLGFRGFF
jgi:hypothetical protein